MSCVLTTDPVPRGVAAVAGVVVPVEAPLHRHGRGEGPEVRPALATLLEAGAEAGGRGGELSVGEHLLQDVRGVAQPGVGRIDGVGADGVLLILNNLFFTKNVILWTRNSKLPLTVPENREDRLQSSE